MAQHLQAAQHLAAGLHALPSATSAWAATQAAWRFLHNPRVTLPALVEPLRDEGRRAAAASHASHLLVVHDWSFLAFPTHPSKDDRIRHGREHALGYDLATALLVDAATGDPLAPMDLALTTTTGVVSSRSVPDAPPVSHIDQVLGTMTAAATWGLKQPLVHVIDREADGLAQFRRWSEAGHRFVVRVDANRRVEWEGASRTLPEVVEGLQSRGAFAPVHAADGDTTRTVAETVVVYRQPGRVREGTRRRLVPGDPLAVRLVVSRVFGADGAVVAEWLLVTNVSAESATAAQVSRWYAWRWRIESLFKLLKQQGHQVESWQQESGEAIGKRLAVAAMACVVAWRVVRDRTPAGRALAELLVRLSGRQMKRSKPVTDSAVMAGLEKLLAVLDLLEDVSAEELRQLLHHVLNTRPNTG